MVTQTAPPSGLPSTEGFQLPHPDLVDQLEPPTKYPAPWPKLLPRMIWATERTVDMDLSGVEAAILKHV